MIILLIFACILMLATLTRPAFGCFAVVAGKKASSDGSVLFGHNEQDGGKRILNFRVIHRIKAGNVTRLWRGGTLPEVPETYSFMWSENPGLEFSDVYINEWGVAAASDGCGTREDSYDDLVARGEIRDGGIGYMLRRLIIQRSKTAREGVTLAGELLDRFGYADSGRTLVIADPNEAWILSLVRGRHWVARRVPDDEVAILPNVHIISEVNLQDTDNFMGAADIIDYAIKRGWYDPSCGKPFSFRDAYNPPSNNLWDTRQLIGQSLVAQRTANLPGTEQLPFSVKPDRRLNVSDVAKILRHHGTNGSLCAPETLEGAVFQLRNWMPPEVGCVNWRTSAEPCMNTLIPWYLGITKVPEAYHKNVNINKHLSLDYHFDPPEGTYDYDPNHAWWTFRKLQDMVNRDYQSHIEKAHKVWDEFEARLFADQESIEDEAMRILSGDKKLGRDYLTDYSKNVAKKAAELANTICAEIDNVG